MNHLRVLDRETLQDRHRKSIGNVLHQNIKDSCWDDNKELEREFYDSRENNCNEFHVSSFRLKDRYHSKGGTHVCDLQEQHMLVLQCDNRRKFCNDSASTSHTDGRRCYEDNIELENRCYSNERIGHLTNGLIEIENDCYSESGRHLHQLQNKSEKCCYREGNVPERYLSKRFVENQSNFYPEGNLCDRYLSKRLVESKNNCYSEGDGRDRYLPKEFLGSKNNVCSEGNERSRYAYQQHNEPESYCYHKLNALPQSERILDVNDSMDKELSYEELSRSTGYQMKLLHRSSTPEFHSRTPELCGRGSDHPCSSSRLSSVEHSTVCVDEIRLPPHKHVPNNGTYLPLSRREICDRKDVCSELYQYRRSRGDEDDEICYDQRRPSTIESTKLGKRGFRNDLDSNGSRFREEFGECADCEQHKRLRKDCPFFAGQAIRNVENQPKSIVNDSYHPHEGNLETLDGNQRFRSVKQQKAIAIQRLHEHPDCYLEDHYSRDRRILRISDAHTQPYDPNEACPVSYEKNQRCHLNPQRTAEIREFYVNHEPFFEDNYTSDREVRAYARDSYVNPHLRSYPMADSFHNMDEYTIADSFHDMDEYTIADSYGSERNDPPSHRSPEFHCKEFYVDEGPSCSGVRMYDMVETYWAADTWQDDDFSAPDYYEEVGREAVKRFKKDDILKSKSNRDVRSRLGGHLSEAEDYRPLHVINDLSSEFKKVEKAFFIFSKQLNFNPSLRRRYLLQGKAGGLFCIVCGRSQNVFENTQALAKHALTSPKVELRAKHLALHRAVCVLMGWDACRSSKVSVWTPACLSASEAWRRREDLILWPPVVIVRYAFENVIPSDKVLTFLRGKGLFSGKVKVAQGQPADQSVLVLMFLGTFSGLGSAESVHRYFNENKRGRCHYHTRLKGCVVSGKLSDEDALYGYLGTASDVDLLDTQTKRQVLVKSKKSIQDFANESVKRDDSTY